jgi:hypothetical protein
MAGHIATQNDAISQIGKLQFPYAPAIIAIVGLWVIFLFAASFCIPGFSFAGKNFSDEHDHRILKYHSSVFILYASLFITTIIFS